MTTPRKITLEEAKDIAYELANRDDASDDLRALCQFVGLLDADSLEDERRAQHQANELALEIRRIYGEHRKPDLAGLQGATL